MPAELTGAILSIVFTGLAHSQPLVANRLDVDNFNLGVKHDLYQEIIIFASLRRIQKYAKLQDVREWV
jgi:hypothetical protein